MALPNINDGPGIIEGLRKLNDTTDSGLILIAEVMSAGYHETHSIGKAMHRDVIAVRDAVVSGFDSLISSEKERWRIEDERNKRAQGVADENAAEAERLRQPTARVITAAEEDEQPKGLTSILLNTLKSPIALIGIAIAAWAVDLDKVLRAIRLPQTLKWLANLFVDIEIMLKSVRQGFKVAALGEGFANLRNLVIGKTGFLGRIGAFFGDLVVSVNKAISFIQGPIKALAGTLSKLRIFKVVASTFDDIARAFGPFISGASRAFGFLKPLGGIFKFLAGPISMAIFGLLDFAKGFMKGFEEGGFLSGIKEGVLEVFRGFVTYPLDLLKDIISWMAGQLGFDSVEKALDSFSFTQLFDRLVDSPLDLVKDMLSWVASKFGFDQFAKSLDKFSFKDLYQNVTDAITTSIKKIVADVLSFLPRSLQPEWLREWASGKSGAGASKAPAKPPAPTGPAPAPAGASKAPAKPPAPTGPSRSTSVAGPASGRSGPTVKSPTGGARTEPQVISGQGARGTRATQDGPMTLPGGVLSAAAGFIRLEEGLPKDGKAYKDAGGITIGYGHYIKDYEYKQGYIQVGKEKIKLAPNPIDTTITPIQAEKLLYQDLPKYETAASGPLGEAWGKLDNTQKAALISYAYNTGSTSSLVNSGLKAAILSNDMQLAADIIRNRGTITSQGVVSNVLVARRDREADVFAAGESAPMVAGENLQLASGAGSDQRTSIVPASAAAPMAVEGPPSAGSAQQHPATAASIAPQTVATATPAPSTTPQVQVAGATPKTHDPISAQYIANTGKYGNLVGDKMWDKEKSNWVNVSDIQRPDQVSLATGDQVKSSLKSDDRHQDVLRMYSAVVNSGDAKEAERLGVELVNMLQQKSTLANNTTTTPPAGEHVLLYPRVEPKDIAGVPKWADDGSLQATGVDAGSLPVYAGINPYADTKHPMVKPRDMREVWGPAVGSVTESEPTSCEVPVVTGARSGISPTAIAAGPSTVQMAADKESMAGTGSVVNAPVIAPNNTRINNISSTQNVINPNPRPDEPSYLMLTNALYGTVFG